MTANAPSLTHASRHASGGADPVTPAAIGASAPVTVTAVKTAPYTAAAQDMIPVDTTSGGITVTLPAAPADKTRVVVKKIDSSANVVTVQRGGSDVFDKASGGTSLTLTLQFQTLSVQYNSATSIWYVVATDRPLAGLATGVVKNTTTTGAPSIAVAADIPVVAPGVAGPLNAADTTLIVADANGHFPTTAMPLSAQRDVLSRRTGAFAETIRREDATTNTVQVLGQLSMASIVLLKGQVVTKIVFLAGSTGLNTPTNQWFALWNSAFGLIGTTSDDTTTAWGASSEKSLNMLANYTVLADGLFYVSCLVAATTANSLVGSAPSAISVALAPALNGRDTTHTGLTNLASCPSTATMTANAIRPYAWVG